MHLPPPGSHDLEQIEELLERLAELSETAPDASFADLLSRDASLAELLRADPVLATLLEERHTALRRMVRMIDETKHCDNGLPKIPGFQAISILGYGGAGVVYRARQNSLKRDVAIKLMLGGRFASPRQRERFRCEAEIIARLHHPNIASIYDHGEHEGLPYLVQELLLGGSLADHGCRRSIDVRAAAQLVRTAAEAIHYAHRNGVVHRDLKPGNLLLNADGVPKVIDFGLAKTLDSDGGFTRTGETPGTPSYMAPEQITGASVGPHTDIYGLGAILYELLYDVPPFSGGSSATVFERILKSSPKPPRSSVAPRPGGSTSDHFQMSGEGAAASLLVGGGRCR